MSQVINTNSLSLVAQNNLNKSQKSLGTAIERLSSGLRINSAKDDAAGQAISNRFTASINGLSQASRNANDGISIAQTTEGALNEVNDNLQNIRRLTVQAQNGTNSDSDKASIQAEIDQRLSEIDRISSQTEFNGVYVLSQDQTLSIQVGANDGQTIDIQLNKMDAGTLGMTNFAVADGLDVSKLKPVTTTDKFFATEAADPAAIDVAANSTALTGKIEKITYDATAGKYYGVDTAGDSFALTIDNAGKMTAAAAKSTPANATVEVDKVAYDTGKAIDDTAIKAAGGKVQTDGAGNYYINNADGSYTSATGDAATGAISNTGKKVLTGTATTDPLAAIDAALAKVDDLRSGLGAVQNRFDSVINNLNSTVNNLSASQSRILDADYATEVSNMSRAQILQQAGTTVLAQANQVPQNVLSLLR